MRRRGTAAAALPLLAGLAAACSPAPAAESPDDLRAHWEAGRTWEAFEEAAEARRDTWVRNRARARVPDDVARRAAALEGTWRLLVVAVDRCGDSAHTVPYLAALAASSPALDLRIVDPEAGRALMEARPTPDGRAATPTVVVLDEGFRDAGCWVERPTELQRWFLANPEGLDEDDLYARKYAWYEEDAGASTLRDVMDVLEAAAAGARICGETAAPRG